MNFGPHNLNVMNSEVVLPAPLPPTIEATRDLQFVGRHQVGEKVTLELKTVGSSLFSKTGAVKPDAVPNVRIYSPVATTRGFTIPVDSTNLSAKGIFRGEFTPGPTDSASHYFALFAYSVGGSPRASISMFEVLSGGHRNGPVLSSYYVPQPAGSVFIAHEESGVVVQGLRPYLDPGD